MCSLSNLAIKINEKLASSVFGETRAWTTSFDGRPGSGLPWVSEKPTLVIGVTTSSGIGQNALSIICGSVGLDHGLMQMGQDIRTQDKSELIHPSVLKALVKTLALHFYQHNNVEPQVSFYGGPLFFINTVMCIIGSETYHRYSVVFYDSHSSTYVASSVYPRWFVGRQSQ